MDNGKTFEIKAHNLSNENIYVTKATLKGKPLLQSWFKHTEISDGGLLELYMNSTPNEWGIKNPPPSISDVKN